MNERDTQAVTAAPDDRPRLDLDEEMGSCRRCGAAPMNHLREKFGLERVLCAEPFLRSMHGDR